MLALLEDPSILFDLGRYEERAEAQLAELGDVKGEAAPREVAAHITDARSGKEPESIAVLIAWLRSVIPTRPVSHYWVSLRLLWGLPENIRKFDVPRVPLALLQCRKHPDLAGWWRVEDKGGRRQSFYQRPEMPFDL
jgi:hypothetical protein